MRIKETLALFALGLAIAASAHAGVSRQERKQAKEHFSGPLYIRFNAPCTQGRHPFGVYYYPLVEVSPTGTNADVPDGGTSVGLYH
ncbi:MAG TPA: hypothetical protein VLF66_19995, partial [Thermoanaerobaculia bacterium]|nr:hypothetical protein [Thermoanaerobaculia bacterium]